MELSAKERAVKEIVLEEFQRKNEPGYAEKKNLIEELNADWIDKEVEKLRTGGRYLPWFIVVGGSVVATAWATMLVIGETSNWMRLNHAIQMLFALVAFVGGGIYNLYSRWKRLFLLRILQVIAGNRVPRSPQAVHA